MQFDYGGMQQYVMWANATGLVEQFYTDSSLQVALASVCMMQSSLSQRVRCFSNAVGAVMNQLLC